MTCLDTNCPTPLICDSDLSYPNDDATLCVNASCCERFGACIGDGSDAAIVACNDCLADGGGAVCDGYAECLELNCSDFFN